MAAFKLPVLMNRWELFSISASVVYMYTIPSDVLKGLLKTTSFLNFVKHCLSARCLPPLAINKELCIQHGSINTVEWNWFSKWATKWLQVNYHPAVRNRIYIQLLDKIYYNDFLHALLGNTMPYILEKYIIFNLNNNGQHFWASQCSYEQRNIFIFVKLMIKS